MVVAVLEHIPILDQLCTELVTSWTKKYVNTGNDFPVQAEMLRFGFKAIVQLIFPYVVITQYCSRVQILLY